MVKINKIYTRTGDKGDTGLSDGTRVAKHAPRVAAYGDVDEANTVIGLVRLHTSGVADEMLARIQNELFDLGADLSTPGDDYGDNDGALRITAGQVERLEQEIDQMNAHIDALTSFILPGGSVASAHLHHARTVTRRAERTITGACEHTPINPLAIKYINRLSDHLFVMARLLNDGGKADILWQPGNTR
jgi:cob(I)alamin adenosyltransferase